MSPLFANWSIVGLHALLFVALLWPRVRERWKIAERLLAVHLGLALLLWLTQVLFGGPGNFPSEFFFRATALSLTVLALVSFVGFVVLRYARRNLAGDPDKGRFLTWYLATLLAVGVTITANHLVIFVVAWASISLSLHRLLLFYPDRPRATLAAHKKFILARFSELLLIAALLLLYVQHQSLNISTILSKYPADVAISVNDHIVALLLAAVALIKCAQLPLHGWLIQVVEAPTPVSALLHAGIINLGGFLLLLFAPLLSASVVAQWFVLIVAGISCVVAALIMMTRISIKVRLAWSTVAQMGLMLVECALGLYEIALLHLIAHSSYKAHAFLNSGDAVSAYLRHKYAQTTLPRLWHWLFAGLMVAMAAAVVISIGEAPTLYSPWILVAIAATTLLATSLDGARWDVALWGLAMVALGCVAYVLLGQISGHLVPVTEHYSLAADVWISLLFLGLFTLYLILQYAPRNASVQKLFVALNAGLYLDEWATRVTLWLWPLRLPATHAKRLAP